MCEILIPIHPEHVEKILRGTKKWEYRKRKPRKEVTKLIFYATKPKCKVVGEAEVQWTYYYFPYWVWEWSKWESGLTFEQYAKYFKGKKRAVAFRLGKVKKYNKPKELSEYGIDKPPQSFIYVNRKE